VSVQNRLRVTVWLLQPLEYKIARRLKRDCLATLPQQNYIATASGTVAFGAVATEQSQLRTLDADESSKKGVTDKS
jgi:hypothetical protein